MSLRRGLVPVALAVLVVLAGGAAVAGAAGLAGEPDPDSVSRSAPATATGRVSRRTLVETVSVAGELGFGTARPLKVTAAGTVTWLPPAGAMISRGQPALRIDDRPVVLLYGSLPLYRPLTLDTKGSDVRQFEQNLRALDYDGFTVDDEFTASTVDAVKRWQKELGLAQSGTVTADQVVYAPGPVRLAQRSVEPGDPAAGEVFTYTGTARVVSVPVRADAAGWAIKGAAVTVELPGGATVPGTVTDVGDQAEAGSTTETEGAGGPDASLANATIPVTVSLADQKAAGRYQRSPVSVRHVSREREDVLTVPVAALLALAEGGYGLELVDGAATRTVPVRVGLFADGQVEVEGPELRDGQTVRMPG